MGKGVDDNTRRLEKAVHSITEFAEVRGIPITRVHNEFDNLPDRLHELVYKITNSRMHHGIRDFGREMTPVIILVTMNTVEQVAIYNMDVKEPPLLKNVINNTENNNNIILLL